MWDQILSYQSEWHNAFPWISFLAGMGGSLHCVAMCGGLVTSTCSNGKDIMRYQLGRLLGYLGLALLAGFIGSALGGVISSFWPSFLSSILLGLLFIYWGVMNYRGKKVEVPLPRFLQSSYYKLWTKLVKGNMGLSRAFFTGLISIMLPCGLLYGVVIGLVAVQQTSAALIGMFFFWLGTLPAMVLAPGIVRKVIQPFKSKLPRVYAASLILVGVVTITQRMINHSQASLVGSSVAKEHKSCH